jgi:hypothetical protein
VGGAALGGAALLGHGGGSMGGHGGGGEAGEFPSYGALDSLLAAPAALGGPVDGGGGGPGDPGSPFRGGPGSCGRASFNSPLGSAPGGAQGCAQGRRRSRFKELLEAVVASDRHDKAVLQQLGAGVGGEGAGPLAAQAAGGQAGGGQEEEQLARPSGSAWAGGPPDAPGHAAPGHALLQHPGAAGAAAFLGHGRAAGGPAAQHAQMPLPPLPDFPWPGLVQAHEQGGPGGGVGHVLVLELPSLSTAHPPWPTAPGPGWGFPTAADDLQRRPSEVRRGNKGGPCCAGRTVVCGCPAGAGAGGRRGAAATASAGRARHARCGARDGRLAAGSANVIGFRKNYDSNIIF